MDKKPEFQWKKENHAVFTSAKMNNLLKELTTSQEYEMLDLFSYPKMGLNVLTEIH